MDDVKQEFLEHAILRQRLNSCDAIREFIHRYKRSENNEFMWNLVYDPVFKYLCVQNCAFQILNQMGCKHTKQLFNCSLNYRAKIIRSGNIAASPIVFNRQNANDFLLPFVGYKGFSASDGEAVWKENLEVLKSGMPFIAIVDVYHVWYRNEYRKVHGSHAVIVGGFNAREEKVKVIDWYDPYYFQGDICLNEFILARNSNNPKCNNPFSGAPISNEWIYIYPQKCEIKIEKCLLENIRNCLVYKMNDSSVTFGTESINNLIELIRQNAETEFYSSLYNELFPLLRIYGLLCCNILDFSLENSYISQYVEEFVNYKRDFERILFCLLKTSFRSTEFARNILCDELRAFLNSSLRVFSLLNVIYNLIQERI